MDHYLAPMEGITGYLYRNAVREIFGDPYTRYFTPFIVPRPKAGMQKKERRDMLPENNSGIDLVPQILSNNAADVLQLTHEIRESYGYEEFNLNFGCPSSTVTSGGRGAGMLKDPAALDHMLEELFAQTTVKISVKTRIGIEDPEEYEALFAVYEKYPLTELIIHPRVLTDLYKKPARPEYFARIRQKSRLPLVYNGDIFRPEDEAEKLPDPAGVRAVMLGRGAIADPALPRRLQGGAPASAEELRAFHDRIYYGYLEVFGDPTPVLFHMKELWGFMSSLCPGGEKPLKRLRKAKAPAEYLAAVRELLQFI